MAKQPIDFLFSSHRQKVLAVLFLSADERFHVRQLKRLTGASAGSLPRELKAMSRAGLLKRGTQGNQVLYRVDSDCPIYEELASTFRKTVGMATLLRDGLEPLRDQIEFAFVFGSMASGKPHKDSDLHHCVLGNASLLEVVTALGDLHGTLRREINPVVMTASDFIEQLAADDRFAERLYREPRVFVMGRVTGALQRPRKGSDATDGNLSREAKCH